MGEWENILIFKRYLWNLKFEILNTEIKVCWAERRLFRHRKWIRQLQDIHSWVARLSVYSVSDLLCPKKRQMWVRFLSYANSSNVVNMIAWAFWLETETFLAPFSVLLCEVAEAEVLAMHENALPFSIVSMRYTSHQILLVPIWHFAFLINWEGWREESCACKYVAICWRKGCTLRDLSSTPSRSAGIDVHGLITTPISEYIDRIEMHGVKRDR